MKLGFRDMGPREFGKYYEALNQELPVEKCPLDLDDEMKERYGKALEKLKNERKAHPDVPLFYPTAFELDW